jgi:hypothetical protein
MLPVASTLAQIMWWFIHELQSPSCPHGQLIASVAFARQGGEKRGGGRRKGPTHRRFPIRARKHCMLFIFHQTRVLGMKPPAVRSPQAAGAATPTRAVAGKWTGSQAREAALPALSMVALA